MAKIHNCESDNKPDSVTIEVTTTLSGQKYATIRSNGDSTNIQVCPFCKTRLDINEVVTTD